MFFFFFFHFTLESYIGIFRSYRQTHNLVKIVFFFFVFVFVCFFAGFRVYFFLYVSNGTGLIVWTSSRTFYPNWIDEKHCFDSLLRVDS